MYRIKTFKGVKESALNQDLEKKRGAQFFAKMKFEVVFIECIDSLICRYSENGLWRENLKFSVRVCELRDTDEQQSIAECLH